MGTPKRSTFYTSILGGTPKRGAFCTSILGGTPKRGAFCTSYLVATPKRGAFCTSYLVATPKRGAFCTSYLVATPKRAAYSYSRVGAYCIRPIRRNPWDGECANRINYHDSSFHKWNVCRAYAIRPYTGTPKRSAFDDLLCVICSFYRIIACFYSSFLALMQEKKQKKIKASAEAGEVDRVHDWRGPDLCHVPGKLPCLGRDLWPRFHSPNGAK